MVFDCLNGLLWRLWVGKVIIEHHSILTYRSCSQTHLMAMSNKHHLAAIYNNYIQALHTMGQQQLYYLIIKQIFQNLKIHSLGLKLHPNICSCIKYIAMLWWFELPTRMFKSSTEDNCFCSIWIVHILTASVLWNFLHLLTSLKLRNMQVLKTPKIF
jgi:hypothetical protein